MRDLLHLSDLQSWKKLFLPLWHISCFIKLMHGLHLPVSAIPVSPHAVDGSDQDLCNSLSQLSLETSG